MTSMFDDQAHHIAYLDRRDAPRAARPRSSRPRKASARLARRHQRLPRRRHVSFLETCTPGYYNNEGHTKAGSSFFGAYTPGINAFNELLEGYREQGDLAGLELDGSG